MKNDKLILLTVVGIFVLGMVVYMPVLRNEFVYDDFWLIVENDFIRDIRNVRELFRRDFTRYVEDIRGASRPVSLVSFMVDYEIYKLVNKIITDYKLQITNLLKQFSGKVVKWYSDKVTKEQVESGKSLELRELVESSKYRLGSRGVKLSVVMHLVNILVHSVNSVLVFWLIMKIMNYRLQIANYRLEGINEVVDDRENIFNKWNIFSAFVGSVVFMLHPLQLESVSVVSFRSGMLSVMFGLVGLILITDYRLQVADYRLSILFLLVSVIMFGMSVLSKETGIVFVVVGIVLLVTDYRLQIADYKLQITNYKLQIVGLLRQFSGKGLKWYRDKVIKEDSESGKSSELRVKSLMWVLGGVLWSLGVVAMGVWALYYWARRVDYNFFTMIFVNIENGKSPLESWGSYLNTIFASLRHYVVKFFYPVELSIDYQIKISDSLLNINFFVFIIVVIAVVVMFTRVKNFLLRLGIVFLVLNYLPVSNIIPLANTVADRYMYSVMVGVGVMVAGIVNYGLQIINCRLQITNYKLSSKECLTKVIISLGFIILFLILVIKDIDRFSDMGSLYERAVKVSPENPRVLYNYALTRMEKGEYELALKELKKVQEISPLLEVKNVWKYIARCYGEIGNIYEEKKYYLKLFLLTRAGDKDVLLNLARIYFYEGRLDKVKWLVERSLEIGEDAVSYNFLGMCETREKKYTDAVKSFKRAIELNPSYTDAWLNLIDVYEILGEKRMVLEYSDKMARLYAENLWTISGY